MKYDPYYTPEVIEDIEQYERFLRDKVRNSLDKSAALCEKAKGTPAEAEQRAIAFGKAQAFYLVGLLSERAFTAYRRKFGY